MYNTNAVLHDALLQSEATDGDVAEAAMLFGLGKDEEAIFADVPDPRPTRKNWVTTQRVKGFPKPGTGRMMGFGLGVRL